MTRRAKATPPPKNPGVRVDRRGGTGHHCKCPICGHMVDEEDLDEVFQHLEPDHQAPVKN